MSRFRGELAQATWPRSMAELGKRGVSRHVLAGPTWIQVSRGYYRPATEAPLTPTQRILDAAVRLPVGGAIADWAAAFVQGVDQLDGFDDHTMDPLPVSVRLPPRLHRRSIHGIRYVQPDRSVEVHEVAGVLVTSPRDTLLDLARWAPNVVEAVVSVDAVLGAGLTALPELHHRLEIGPGARQLKQAVELSRAGVLSSWESRLRMFYVLALGFPAPQVNRPVFDLNGRFLGVPDLLDEEAGLAMEYDGTRWRSAVEAGHRDLGQHHRDNHREEGLERAGLIVVRADKIDLTRERALLATRLRAARSDGLRRDRSRDRWTLAEPARWLGLPA